MLGRSRVPPPSSADPDRRTTRCRWKRTLPSSAHPAGRAFNDAPSSSPASSTRIHAASRCASFAQPVRAFSGTLNAISSRAFSPAAASIASWRCRRPSTTTALRLRRRCPTTPARARLEARRAGPAARQWRSRAPCRPRPRPRPLVRRPDETSAHHARQSNVSSGEGHAQRPPSEPGGVPQRIARVRVSGSAPPLRSRHARGSQAAASSRRALSSRSRQAPSCGTGRKGGVSHRARSDRARSPAAASDRSGDLCPVPPSSAPPSQQHGSLASVQARAPTRRCTRISQPAPA
eukprot:7388398-Prymnesium_polylepis.2